MAFDRLDADIIRIMTDEPRIGVYEVSRRIGVARGTVQARLDRMAAVGVIKDFGPTIDVTALGYTVTAFVSAEIAQGRRHESVIEHLRHIAEVLEVGTVTGRDDLWIRVVARSNDDLQQVLDRIATHPHILRTSTTIMLGAQVPYRALPLVELASENLRTSPRPLREPPGGAGRSGAAPDDFEPIPHGQRGLGTM